MEWILFYVALAIIVGVAANTRGRSGLGWFLLALLISPLISGLLVLALPRVERAVVATSERGGLTTEYRPASSAPDQPFEPDGVIKGFPYRVGENGAIEAMMTGGLVRFREMDQFQAAAEGRDAARTEAPISPRAPGMIRIIRRSSFAFGLRSFKISVDGKQVGTIARNSVLDFPVPSGLHIIEARIDWTRSSPLTIEVAPEQRIDIEVSTANLGFSLTLKCLLAA